LPTLADEWLRWVGGGRSLRVAGPQLSDKWFVYGMAVQMAATAAGSGGGASLSSSAAVVAAAALPAVAGVLAGVVHRWVPAVRALRLPQAFERPLVQVRARHGHGVRDLISQPGLGLLIETRTTYRLLSPPAPALPAIGEQS
jgi:hypothetical protein